MRFSAAYDLPKQALLSFIKDEALSRGAAIAFYTVTSIAPLLLIVIAVAGLFSGHEVAQAAITAQLSGLMGPQTAQFLETAVTNASAQSSSGWAMVTGIAALIATASGAFGEIQSALNAIWKAEPKGATVTRLIRARAASLGLVATLGFLLVVSLVASAAVTVFGQRLDAVLPFGQWVAAGINTLISLALLSVLFGAVYKILPDRKLAWRDVVLGAAVTSILFVAGKSLIGWYIGSSDFASTYGAAGSLIVLLLWVYYSVQTFLLGAEFTKAFANRHGSKRGAPVPSEA